MDSVYASSKQLRIDEMWLGSAYAGGGTTTPPSTVEAEASGNTLSGAAAVSSCSACSGGAKVRFIGNNSSNYAVLNDVTATAAGNHDLTIAYAVNGTRTFDLSVNGGSTITVTCTGTDFNTPATTTVTVPLNAGSNTIKFSNTSAYAPDLDAVTVR